MDVAAHAMIGKAAHSKWAAYPQLRPDGHYWSWDVRREEHSSRWPTSDATASGSIAAAWHDARQRGSGRCWQMVGVSSLENVR